jgi:hypothetical protein
MRQFGRSPVSIDAFFGNRIGFGFMDNILGCYNFPFGNFFLPCLQSLHTYKLLRQQQSCEWQTYVSPVRQTLKCKRNQYPVQ